MAAPPFTLGVPIPAILWSSIEDVLGTNMRMFAKDIAKTLGRPEGPLLQAIQAKKISPYILEESAEKEIDLRCQVLCVKPEAPFFVQPCCHPIAWNSTTKRCIEHLSGKSPSVPHSLPVLRRLEHSQPLYVSEDSTVYSADNVPVGRYSAKTLTLFMVDPE